MILRPLPDGLLCITQPDHAALAATLAEAWAADGLADRPTRGALIEAARQHDLGWAEVDESPVFDPASGLPYDFIHAPVATRQGLWPRAVDQLAVHDPYVAALVAQHALTIYRRYQHDPAWHPFFPQMEARRDDLFAEVLARSGRLDSFLQDYTIVGLCDLLSLVFCHGWAEPYLMEDYRAILDGDRLGIAPDPFAGVAVPLAVRARRLPPGPFASAAALADAWARASMVTLTGLAVGMPAEPPA
jgi:hypothetical protein